MNIGVSEDGIGNLFWFAIGAGMTLDVAGLSLGVADWFLPVLLQIKHRYTGAGTAHGFARVFGDALGEFWWAWC